MTLLPAVMLPRDLTGDVGLDDEDPRPSPTRCLGGELAELDGDNGGVWCDRFWDRLLPVCPKDDLLRDVALVDWGMEDLLLDVLLVACTREDLEPGVFLSALDCDRLADAVTAADDAPTGEVIVLYPSSGIGELIAAAL